jgi:hypothetical protein
VAAAPRGSPAMACGGGQWGARGGGGGVVAAAPMVEGGRRRLGLASWVELAVSWASGGL